MAYTARQAPPAAQACMGMERLELASTAAAPAATVYMVSPPLQPVPGCMGPMLAGMACMAPATAVMVCMAPAAVAMVCRAAVAPTLAYTARATPVPASRA